MFETEYAYAVARIRSNELSLLTPEDIEMLVSADSYETALRILTDKGWSDTAGKDGADMFEEELGKALKIISECDSRLADALVAGNDFANLKAAIKCVFSDNDTDKYMTGPYVCSPELIAKAIKENDYGELPDYLADVADKAYHAVTESHSGQLAEIVTDKACLDRKLKLAKESGSDLLYRITSLSCLVAAVKTAVRSARTGKSKEFALDALCNCPGVDNEKLADAAFEGEKLGPIVAEAGYENVADYVDGDFADLEMKCDNLIVEMIETAKHEIYGPDPLAAYYYAKLAEVKNVRIILSAKSGGVPESAIRQRVRDIYV